MSDHPEPLIAAARAGDSATLGRLLEYYRNYLRVLARIEIGRRLQGKLDASDVVQEAFLNAHRQFPAFRGSAEPQFAKWLREILAGTLANQIRRYAGTQARDIGLEVGLVSDLDQSAGGLAHIVPADPHSSPSQHVSMREQTVLVAAALARLPDDYQTVIVLRHLEGLPFAQVAERMGRTVDSVEKLWLRGITQLRRAMERATHSAE